MVVWSCGFVYLCGGIVVTLYMWSCAVVELYSCGIVYLRICIFVDLYVRAFVKL